MKKTIIIIALLLTSFYLRAQDQQASPQVEAPSKNKSEIKTIFGSKKVSHGGYFGITANYGELNHQNAYFTGIKLGWIINHSFTIGLGGYGFFTDEVSNYTSKSQGYAGGYGGLLLEPIILPKFPVHVSFPILLGTGGIANVNNYSSTDEDYAYEDSNVFVFVEPGMEIEINVVKALRLAFGATYRVTSDVFLPNTSKTVLQGLSAGFSLKVGKF